MLTPRVISDGQHGRSLLRRVFRLCRETVLWLLAISPGCLLIAYGANGIRQERLVTIGRFARYERVLQGADAVGWGWIFIGVGFWSLGCFCHLKSGRAVVKYLGWAFAVVLGMIGMSVLLKN